jgi:hypothetical protein
VTTSAAATRARYRLRLVGGAAGNARLTALAGALLLVLLAVEGATIPFIRPLLSVHIFVGLLLLGPVALKLATTGYRFARYYGGAREYVALGPPELLMRVLVAPVLVLTTLTLFATGVALVASPHRGAVLGLHKASFVVWFGACGIHVLAYGLRTFRRLVAAVPAGELVRLVVVLVAIAAGVVVAVEAYPLAAPWLHGEVGWDR